LKVKKFFEEILNTLIQDQKYQNITINKDENKIEVVSTRYEFSRKAINYFEEDTGISLHIRIDQQKSLDEKGCTALSLDQLLDAAQALDQENNPWEYVRREASDYAPLSLSLYVFNQAVWKLMTKKTVNQETMLAMATIPWFYWDKGVESEKNPFGAKRDTHHNSIVDIEPGKSVKITGKGGNFCGILDGRIAAQRKVGRPILIPNLPESGKLVPYYEPDDVSVILSTNGLASSLYPKPDKRIDYSFSEHPRNFYDHGIQISATDSTVKLQIGNKKPQAMFGETIVLLGKTWDAETLEEKVVQYHTWLAVLHQLIQ
jgi:hypothetical protein